MDGAKLSAQSPTDHNRPHFSRPHLLTADTQSGGRGQHGRTWQSPLGNVYLSLYVPTQAYAWQQNLCLSYRLDGRLSLCVGYQLSQIPIIEAHQSNKTGKAFANHWRQMGERCGFLSTTRQPT
ncbi:MAG: hypothetical protein U1E91_02295 [Moraxella sp.]